MNSVIIEVAVCIAFTHRLVTFEKKKIKVQITFLYDLIVKIKLFSSVSFSICLFLYSFKIIKKYIKTEFLLRPNSNQMNYWKPM